MFMELFSLKFYNNGVYKMWYTKLFACASANIWYAESLDGIYWYSNYDTPVIKLKETWLMG